MALPDLQDTLVRWEAVNQQLADLRRELSSLEVQRSLGYRDAWLNGLHLPVTERNKTAEVDVMSLVAEIAKVRADIDTHLDEIAYLKAAAHHAASAV